MQKTFKFDRIHQNRISNDYNDGIQSISESDILISPNMSSDSSSPATSPEGSGPAITNTLLQDVGGMGSSEEAISRKTRRGGCGTTCFARSAMRYATASLTRLCGSARTVRASRGCTSGSTRDPSTTPTGRTRSRVSAGTTTKTRRRRPVLP